LDQENQLGRAQGNSRLALKKVNSLVISALLSCHIALAAVTVFARAVEWLGSPATKAWTSQKRLRVSPTTPVSLLGKLRSSLDHLFTISTIRNCLEQNSSLGVPTSLIMAQSTRANGPKTACVTAVVFKSGVTDPSTKVTGVMIWRTVKAD